MQERIRPAGGASRSGDDLGGFIRAPRGAPAGNSPFNYRLAESKLYCNEICDAGQGAAGLLISQIRGPGSQVDLCEW